LDSYSSILFLDDGVHGFGWAKSQSITRGENSEDIDGTWLPSMTIQSSTAPPGGAFV
jgi:hypothetical protein